MVAVVLLGNIGEVVVKGNVVVNCNVGKVIVEGNVTEGAVEVKWLLSWSRATLARLWS